MAERLCRCLTRDDESQRPLYEQIQDYLSTLPSESRADDATYAERLSVCKACAHLRAGGCALCGCYVEIRAAKRLLGCPDVPARWAALPKS